MNNYFDPNVFKGQPIYSNENIPNIINTNTNYDSKYMNVNKGKKINIYASFPNINEIKEFKGILEYSDSTNIVISNPTDGGWYLIPKKYIDYIIFDEAINYINF